MTKKQYRRKLDFIKGYKQGYQWKGLKPGILHTKSAEYKRGYVEGRKDIHAREPALY